MVEFQIEGDVIIAGSRILLPVSIATVLPGVQMPVAGTVAVSTLQSPITIASIQSPIALAGTISFGTVSVSATVAVGTIPIQQVYKQTNVLTNATVTSGTFVQVAQQLYQDTVVDWALGTLGSGTVVVAVFGVEPQSTQITSTIVAGQTIGPVGRTAQRLQAAGPLGASVSVMATVVGGTATGVYVTVEQSTGP